MCIEYICTCSVCIEYMCIHVVCVLNTYVHVVCVLTIHLSLQSGHTAIDIARSKGQMEVVRLLQQSQRVAAVGTGRRVRIHGNCSRNI